MKNGIDLHSHTNYSDGVLKPRELVNLAKQKELKAIAITDHDTVSGFKEYLNYKEDFGVEVVPGIEIGIKNEKERHLSEVHMLGYFVDYNDNKFLSILDKLNESKEKWVLDQVKILNDNGFKITVEEVKEIAGPAIPRRPHVQKVLEKNNPNKMSSREFYKKTSFGGEYHINRTFNVSLEDSIKLIKDAGGIPVLAHSGFYDTDNVVKVCVDAGLEGIEVNYSYFVLGKEKSVETVKHINNLADKYNLLKTGGSDFHDNIHGTDLGSVDVPYSFLEKMKEFLKK